LFPLGDIHHDGVREFAAVSYVEWIGADCVDIWSGFPAWNARNLDDKIEIDGKGQGSVVAVPDIDGDGVDDLLVGLPWKNPESRGTGIARVYSGETFGLLRVLSLDKLRKQLESRER
jgi:hypothetical protein